MHTRLNSSFLRTGKSALSIVILFFEPVTGISSVDFKTRLFVRFIKLRLSSIVSSRARDAKTQSNNDVFLCCDVVGLSTGIRLETCSKRLGGCSICSSQWRRSDVPSFGNRSDDLLPPHKETRPAAQAADPNCRE
mmetsp:Transcript_39568/g.112194  ORF Transcript_39568/g.112194 Transcript_39568/m.112194 type:complete len:135 (+) Transcript_39568:946-1350(+)